MRGHHLHQPSQPSPPATDPLAKRVLAPAVPGSREERGELSEGQEEDQLRKTSSLTTFSPHQLTGRDYQEKPLVLKLQPKLVESKESSVCSSVLSSMESVESNTSEGEKHELFITAGQLLIID